MHAHRSLTTKLEREEIDAEPQDHLVTSSKLWYTRAMDRAETIIQEAFAACVENRRLPCRPDEVEAAWQECRDARWMAGLAATLFPREQLVPLLTTCLRLLNCRLIAEGLGRIAEYLNGNLSHKQLVAFQRELFDRSGDDVLEASIALSQLIEFVGGSVSPGACASAVIESASVALSIQRTRSHAPSDVEATLSEMSNVFGAAIPSGKILQALVAR